MFSVNVDVQLFIPKIEDDDWRWGVSYATVYLPSNGKIEDVRMYQYFQSKYDATDNIESDGVTIKELEKNINL